jgi:hypothetical protein
VPGETNIVLFLTASLVVIVAPGPDNILVLTPDVNLGRWAALVSAVSWSPRASTRPLGALLAGGSCPIASNAAAS